MIIILLVRILLTFFDQSSSATSLVKAPETFDKTSPADFYGLFHDSKPANKDEEPKVSELKTPVSRHI